MRSLTRFAAGLTLAAAFVPSAALAEDTRTPPAFGKGPAYEALARLPVLHEGRRKPFDTLAREEVKQIFGRETIKLLDASKGNEVVATWAPVAAAFDWSVRPEYWDDQPIILVEYLPLKRMILEDSARVTIAAVGGKSTTSAADRAALVTLATDKALTAATVNAFLATSALAPDDKAALATLASELSEEHKWLPPHRIEAATLAFDGQRLRFDQWFDAVVAKRQKAEASTTGEVTLSEAERRGYEVGTRLVHFGALRDRKMRSPEPLRVMPRPHNAAYMTFLKKTYDKAQKTQSVEGLTSLEVDGASALDKYWNELPTSEREVPGTNPEFDKGFAAWLQGSSSWVPFKALTEAKAEGLAEAGYPLDKASAFFQTLKALEDAEEAAPGNVGADKAGAFVAAARALADSTEPAWYPTTDEVNRETFFNAYNPFFTAPMAYGAATALLAACLGFHSLRRSSVLGQVGRGLYVLGMTGMVAGIGLEMAGFYLRVRISGWAPVTNMYETVIWVSLVSAMIGLVFEGVFRKTFAALAGSGVALLGTVLAANVPLLDPGIRALQPVLRSNYWLTIHVLTEVSSYAAFLLAAGLGVIAIFYYLTATYRRTPTFIELASLVGVGLPFLTVGVLGAMAVTGSFGIAPVKNPLAYSTFAGVAGVGGMICFAAVLAVAGEIAARALFRDDATVTLTEKEQTDLAFSEVGAVPTPKPSVAEIIRKAAQEGGAKLDARGLAMQATAAEIKPLANFIYRAMQVGVLLIAAGTILGGVWADYSWGRFWGWDPKEVWALITLLVYLVPLHGRFAGWFNTFTLVSASIVCSMSVIMAWYGVNFLLGVGLHSYGFVEGGGQGSVFIACAAVLALPIAAGWRRSRGSIKLAVGDSTVMA